MNQALLGLSDDRPNNDDQDTGQNMDFNWNNVKKEILSAMREAAGQVVSLHLR